MSCAVGGLAVEKLGKLAAWGPWRGDADAEKAPPEHAHLRPGPAKEHEVETPGPSGRQISPLNPCALPHLAPSGSLTLYFP